MAKLQRRVVAKGNSYTVECAVRADGSEPAKEFLDLLQEGMWEDDPEAETLPHDEQIKDWHKFLDQIKHVATHGEPGRRSDVNVLQNGLWEFKVGNKRLVFYDTPGDGTYEPKLAIADRSQSPAQESDMWWFPEFDKYLRLANSWPKTGQKTNRVDIEEGLAIREEDLSRDR